MRQLISQMRIGDIHICLFLIQEKWIPVEVKVGGIIAVGGLPQLRVEVENSTRSGNNIG